MGSRSILAGVEVPIIGSDSVKFVDVLVPSSFTIDSNASASSLPFAPVTEDSASCFVIGDPPSYLIWRIQKTLPHALELLELSAEKEFSRIGLRIAFPEALSPFAFICKNEIFPTTRASYLLYALTTSGVAYMLKIRNFPTYTPSSIIPLDELIEFNLQTYPNNGHITSIAATAGFLVVGRSDGSVGLFKLGVLDPNAPDFGHELRDDSGFGRLFGFMSRGRLTSSVQDMVICEVHGKQLIFVLHSDGILRVWDILCHSKIFSHSMCAPTIAGAVFMRLWVGQANRSLNIIPLVILYKPSEVSSEMVCMYNIHFSWGDRITLLPEPSTQNISLEEWGCLDVKLTSDKMWILTDNGLMFFSLFHTNIHMDGAQFYALHEEFVADQLFQSSEHSSDALLEITDSLFSSTKDPPFVSLMFLRRLLHPGVHHEVALRKTLLDYNRHCTDSEFQSLTADGLRKEILSLIEHEGAKGNSVSIFHCWKNFFTRYYHNWCRDNAPCGLLVENSSGAVGLIRKSSVSLFRRLENVELFLDGSSDELRENFDLDSSDWEILIDVVKCIFSINQQLGNTATAIIYESLFMTPAITSEEIMSRILKILDNGYSSSVTFKVSRSGGIRGCERRPLDHKNMRKFSIDMLLSLYTLCNKAAGWGKVLKVIESFLQFLVPRKINQNLEVHMSSDISSGILVQATSQIAKVMFECASDVLLFLSYLINNSVQVWMLPDEKSKIQLELVPMIEEIISEWHIIHFIATAPSESPIIDDFSSQLSSLQIDTSKDSWKEKLGNSNFTVAFLLLPKTISSSSELSNLLPRCLPSPHDIVCSVQNFNSWIIWGKTGESSVFLSNEIELSMILLKHHQYDAVEYLLGLMDAHLRREKTSKSIQDADGGWCMLHHLLGCCLLAQSHYKLHGTLKERKVHEAIRCFFRASSGKGSSEALQSCSHDTGLTHIGSSGAVWRFHYYQWAMQKFEQYNISEGACQFALAALELVDEVLSPNDDHYGRDPLNESAIAIKGRLWANIFKFMLDLDHFYDAYCAIVSNPDEESKYICLRRFVIVLYERGAIKILCGGQLPFIGLTEKVEQELAWKAECSDILSEPNLYKLLYAFETYRHNWRRAASYIYFYSARLRSEVSSQNYQHDPRALQERLNGLAVTINALHLVHLEYSWVDVPERNHLHSKHYPSKKVKRALDQQCDGEQAHKWQSHIGIEKLEDEFLLTSAEYLLTVANVKWTYSGNHQSPSELVDLLVENNLYDTAFSVLIRFWRGSELKRELENVFSALSLKCCPNRVGSSEARNYLRTSKALLLTSTKDEEIVDSPHLVSMSQLSNVNSQWEILELYLGKYKGLHARLPVVVAETLLSTDPQIELPLWLIQMFKDGQRKWTLGMACQGSDPASLVRLFIDYGRYTEATNLLVEFIESLASVRPADIVNRKKPFAVWFPYTLIERLWCQLEALIRSGHMVDQCSKLKILLHGALLSHFKLLKVDEDDALSAIR